MAPAEGPEKCGPRRPTRRGYSCNNTAPWQDILDLAYYSGWRKNEILGLTWDEIDEAGGVIRLSPARSKTLVGRILPMSQPIAEALARRRARRDPDSPLVFHGVVARIVTGPHDAHRQDSYLPMRYDAGRPRAVIRLRISQPRTTSLPCPAGLRARRPSPMMDLYRKNAFSTRP